MRSIGVLMSDYTATRDFVDAVVEELARLGWVDGHNARIDPRWTDADINCPAGPVRIALNP